MQPTDHLSDLSPADAAATLRSLPRRFRSMLAPVGSDDPVEERARRIDETGWSALGHLDHAVRDLDFLGRALEQVLVDDRPALHPGVGGDAARDWPEPSGTLPDELAQLDDAAGTLADRVERVDAADWSRTGTSSGDAVTALDLLRAAVRAALAHLDGVEAALRAAD